MAAVDEVMGEITAPLHRTVGDVKTKSYTTFAPGDVIFAKITPCMENGKSAVVPPITSGLGFGSTEFHVLRPARGVNPRFIWHLVRQESFRRDAEAHMTGSVGQARVPPAFLDSFPILLPPESLQNEIVEMLDATEKGQRNVIDHLAAARRAVGRLRHSVLAAACSGSLTADWRARFGLTDADEPIGWERRPLGQMAARVTKGTTPTSYGHAFTHSGIAFIKVENLANGRIDRQSVHHYVSEETNRKQERSILEAGDLLFSIAGTIGRTAIVDDSDLPANTNQALAIIRGTQAFVLPEYLSLALQAAVQQTAAEAARGSGMNNISLADLRGFEVPVPPKDEQSEIVRRASQLLARADGLLRIIATVQSVIDRVSDSVLSTVVPGTTETESEGK